MITIVDLLEDPHYKEYFLKVPKLMVTRPGARPWRVYVLLKKNKRWARRDFETYPQAFNFFKKLLKQEKIIDGAIHCRRQSWAPPMRWAKIRGKYVRGSDGVNRQAMKQIPWQPALGPDEGEEHTWCPWCRRPTVFRYYSKHHALTNAMGLTVDPSLARCTICGASTRIADWKSTGAAVKEAALRKGKK